MSNQSKKALVFDIVKAREICEEISLDRECTCDIEESCVYRDEKYCSVKAMQHQFDLDVVLHDTIIALLEETKDVLALCFNAFENQSRPNMQMAETVNQLYLKIEKELG